MGSELLEAHIPGRKSSGRLRCRWDRIMKEAFRSLEKAIFLPHYHMESYDNDMTLYMRKPSS